MMLNPPVLLTGAEASMPARRAWPEVFPGAQTGAARPLPAHIQGTCTHVTAVRAFLNLSISPSWSKGTAPVTVLRGTQGTALAPAAADAHWRPPGARGPSCPWLTPRLRQQQPRRAQREGVWPHAGAAAREQRFSPIVTLQFLRNPREQQELEQGSLSSPPAWVSLSPSSPAAQGGHRLSIPCCHSPIPATGRAGAAPCSLHKPPEALGAQGQECPGGLRVGLQEGAAEQESPSR